MDNRLKPYDEYKKVDLPWLDSVPKHWNVNRAKTMYRTINVRSTTGVEELLSVSSNYGVLKRKNANVTMFKAESYVGYKLCWEQDLAVNSLWAWQKGLGFSRYHGIISTAYSVYRLKNSIDFNYKYYDYFVRSEDYLWELKTRSKGIWKSRYQLSDQSFLDSPMLIPTREEQDQIVRYLDWKLAKINKFIKAKKKQIEVLKEQKQAIINEAVTKGLDPNAKMKPSGIEWLGDIPEKWNIKPLKYFVGSNVETLTENFEKESMINYIDISTVGFGELRQKPVTYSFKDAPSRARRIIHCGDTIISTVRTYLKSMCYIDTELDGYIASTGFAVLTPKESVYPKLLNYILSADYFVDRVSRNSIGVSYPAITEKRLTDLKIALPNSLAEQENILEYIEKVTEGINSAISIMQKEIELLSEYRTSLISDVVTGKVDVRNLYVEDEFGEAEIAEFEDSEDSEGELLDTED